MDCEADSDISTTDDDLVPDGVKKAALRAFSALNELHIATLTELGGQNKKQPNKDLEIHWTPQLSQEEFSEKTFLKYNGAISEKGGIEAGRVYCYHCQSVNCEHSLPESDTQVFAGYQDTGRPHWNELLNTLLSLDEDRVDTLFSNRPLVLARVVGRKILIKDQLATYGRSSMTYRIIGQVIAGYFNAGQKRFALTIQVVENRRRTLKFQVITSAYVEEILTNFPGMNGSPFHRLFDALNESRHQIMKLRHRWQRATAKSERSKLQRKIFTSLWHLASSLERKGRQKQRRTSHAEKRLQHDRPIHKAYDDLKSANPERFFLDTTTDSIIVLGKNGRSHVFSKQGRHITSLTLTSDKLELRQRRNRYQPLSSDQIQIFLTQITVPTTTD